jgi:hypothetical protein
MNYLFTLVFAWALTGAQPHQHYREVTIERKLAGTGM